MFAAPWRLSILNLKLDSVLLFLKSIQIKKHSKFVGINSLWDPFFNKIAKRIYKFTK